MIQTLHMPFKLSDHACTCVELTGLLTFVRITWLQAEVCRIHL